MNSVTSQLSVSLDGYVAGPNQSTDNPLGEGGMRLHEWAFPTEAWREQHGGRGGERNIDSEVAEQMMAGNGAEHHGPEDVRRRRRVLGRSF
jgi:hypothetical protein